MALAFGILREWGYQPMIPKPLSQITEDVLNGLIENKVAERKDLDYKRVLPSRSDEDKREFLKDVSSFANTVGGDLIFGMDAPSGGEGVPVAITGIPTDNLEAAKLWFEDLLRTGLQPRLIGHDFRTVTLASGSAVLIIRIPRSWSGPHRVIFKDHGHFYARHSSGKYRLDVPELRNAFLLSESVADRIGTSGRSVLLSLSHTEHLCRSITDRSCSFIFCRLQPSAERDRLTLAVYCAGF